MLDRVEGSDCSVLEPDIHKLWSDFSCRRASLSSALKEVISEQSWMSRLSMSSSLSFKNNLASNRGQLNMQRDETLDLPVVTCANFTSWWCPATTFAARGRPLSVSAIFLPMFSSFESMVRSL
ncbi:hypothetical protein ZEAMMB73_Zm00001d013821 [Zea mays]|uniref:Uncharacterized protein n=1 Tax=Zea mays TaxID=4577 RepID=A0A1D6GMF4_MAIZE|nr:hypothetical protein ZEAMMB73_Zm00001d013821 [Zea mays]